MTNWNNKVMYTGVTGDLEQRVYQHKHKVFEGFTKKYNICKLVYYDSMSDVRAAIAREKEIKGWRRSKKNALVEEMNPTWEDLSLEWEDDSLPCSE
jgi:putative endonuclease